MAREIAVFLDSQGLTGVFGEPGRVRVYRRRQMVWTPEREMEFTLRAEGGLKGLRRNMAELLAFLGECRIFAARSLSGVPYYELEKAGCNIWEQAGDPLTFLEKMWLSEEQERLAQNRVPVDADVPLGPTEEAAGHYWISLKEIQAKSAGITSKQVLQPFLRQGRFTSLEIVCDHVPPWLEVDLEAGKYVWTSEKINGRETKVLIRR